MKSENDNNLQDESFRDSIATIKEGKRNWIYPTQPSGRFYSLRKILSYVYLAIFFALPFININGHQAFQINILERKFYIFGTIFWPQDFFIFGIAMLTGLVFIVLFTVVYGRLFCGWACPQTIFLEMVFRRIEYWIEGDGNAQKHLAKMPWNGEKIRKKGIKWTIFFLISFIISNTFLAYIIGKEDLFRIISEPLGDHIGGFVALLFFTFVFFMVFAWFREQACLIVCPYGRLQGVLLDKNSIVVAYDHVRGEPRGKIKKGEEANSKGDCIDCGLCVRVCPTGIDIRNGTQLECTNCTACIDACDHIMDTVGKPKQLIRYDSEDGIKQGRKFTFTRRMMAYTGVLAVLFSFLVFLLVSRDNIEVTVTRAKGMTYQLAADSVSVTNLYNLKVLNKSQDEMDLQLKVEGLDGTIQVVGEQLRAKSETITEAPIFIKLTLSKLKKRKTPIVIGVYNGDQQITTVKTTFLSPGQKKS